MTAIEGRELALPLAFLGTARSRPSSTSTTRPSGPTSLTRREQTVSAADTLRVAIPRDGGFAARLDQKPRDADRPAAHSLCTEVRTRRVPATSTGRPHAATTARRSIRPARSCGPPATTHCTVERAFFFLLMWAGHSRSAAGGGVRVRHLNGASGTVDRAPAAWPPPPPPHRRPRGAQEHATMG